MMVAHQRQMIIKKRPTKHLLLVVLLEETLAKSTFPCRQIENLTIVEPISEVLCQHLGNRPSAAAQLPTHVNDDIPCLHLPVVYLDF